MNKHSIAYITHEELDDCNHPKCTPAFDEQKANGMSSKEVRKEYPRFYGECPDCGANLIAYASYSHYIAGDW